MKKIFKFIGYILLTLVITLSVYIFVVSEVLKKDYVNIFGYTYFTVATDSMTGTIDINDIIIVKLDDDVNTNDIICYYNAEGVIITHRIVNINGNMITTKGDALNVVDDRFYRSSVIGKVIKIFKPSFIIGFLSLCLIIVIVLIMIII